MAIETNNALYEDRLQHQLNVQATQIQKVLDYNGTPTTIVGGSINREAFSFNLRSPIVSGIEKLTKLKGELKKALGVEGIRLHHADGQVRLQVLRPFVPAVPLLELMSKIKDVPVSTAILGLAVDGTAVQHDFANPAYPNILISGDKNAGKTSLMRSMAASLALNSRQADVQLIIINPISTDSHRRESQADYWRPFNYIPHMLTDVASRQSEISEILFFLVREMNYRSEHLFHSPRIIVFIDQAATVMERGGRTVKEAIMRIAERGSISGIHLVLGTRRPQATFFNPHLLTNLQSHFIGQNNQNLIFLNDNDPTINSSSLLGEGDFFAHGLTRNIRFQAAYIDDYDLHLGLSNLNRDRPILIAQPLSKRVQLNPPSSIEEPEQLFTFTNGLVSVS